MDNLCFEVDSDDCREGAFAPPLQYVYQRINPVGMLELKNQLILDAYDFKPGTEEPMGEPYMVLVNLQ